MRVDVEVAGCEGPEGGRSGGGGEVGKKADQGGVFGRGVRE